MNSSNLSDQLSEPSIRRKLLQFLVLSCITPSTSTNKVTMMPLAPTMTEVPTAHRPKIGFSIDSIVGEKDNRSHRPSSVEKSPNCPTLLNPTSPEKSKTTSSSETSNEMTSPLGYLQKHSQFLHHHLLSGENGIRRESSSNPMPMLLPSHHPLHQLRLPLSHHLSSSSPENRSSANYSPGTISPSNSNSDNLNDSIISRGNGSKDKDERVTNCSNSSSQSGSPRPISDSPSRVVSPEIHRPLVSTHHGSPHPGLLPSSQIPMGPNGLPPFPGYPAGMLNFAMAAAAAQAQNHHPSGHPGIPPWGHPPNVPHHPVSHPLFPWLMARHARFPPRFGGPDLPGFLFQPFRKPKRIRTAFSPSQLLKLEHAFEKNHYVVGAERKQLAKSLSISETQVKVWFQNRRTKHKRVEQEDDPMSMKKSDNRGSGNGSDHPSSGTSADSSTRNYSEEMSGDEDEEIVMDDEDYSEGEEEHGHHSLHHHLHKSYS